MRKRRHQQQGDTGNCAEDYCPGRYKVIDKNTQLGVPNCNVAAPSVIIVMAKALSQIARLKHLTELPLKPHHESK